MVRIKRLVGDGLISLSALAVLLTVLVSVDSRVREQVEQRFVPGRAEAELTDVVSTVQHVGGVLFEAARRQSIEHAPMVIFVLAACVLVMFMLRT